MKKSIIWMSVSALASTISQMSWGFGLGELSMRSFLNEPLSAEVALFDTQSLSAEDIRIGLASEAEFDRLGIQRAYFLTSIRFDIQSGSDGLYIELSTEAPLREPYLDFVLEARWPDGRLLREYTVLVDLPMRASRAMVSPPSPSVSNSALEEPADTAATTAREYDRNAAPVPTPGSDYLVAGSDTLWRIASQAAPPGASVDQTMIEIVARNPEAFSGQNINGLKAGYVLSLPDASQISISDAAAEVEVARQNEAWQLGDVPESGLKLVADNELAAASVEEDSYQEGDTGSSMAEAPVEEVDATIEALESERQALNTTVSDLQSTIVSLEASLTERDRELEVLREQMAEQERSLQLALVQISENQAAARRVSESGLSVWAWIAGLAALFTGGAALWWIPRRQGADEVEAVSRGATRADQPITEDEAPELSDSDDDGQSRAQRAVEEANIYVAYGRVDQAIEVLLDAIVDDDASPALKLRLLECYIEEGQDQSAAALYDSIAATADAAAAERARQLMLAAGLSDSGASTEGEAESGFLSDQGDSVLSQFSFSTDPSFDDPSYKPGVEETWSEQVTALESERGNAPADDDLPDWDDQANPEPALEEGDVWVESASESATGEWESFEAEVADGSAPQESPDSALSSLSLSGDQPVFTAGANPPESEDLRGGLGGLSLAPQDDPEPSRTSDHELEQPLSEAAPKTSGLSLAPIDSEGEPSAGADNEDEQSASAEPGLSDESIHGTETNPVDSKLDLARAYIDMGDEEGARPVLQEVIREGDLSQQAEARELLLRIETA